MKQIAFFLLAGTLILIGCGSKDSGGASVSIVGKWNVNQITVVEYLGNEHNGDTTNAGSITFDNNGNVTAVDEDGNKDSGTYTYNSSSKLLTETGDDTTLVFNVTNLTASNLHLHLEFTQALGTGSTKTVVDEDYNR